VARRGPRQDAGYGKRHIPLEGFVELAIRVAGAILLDALAFIVWNVGTRTPLELVADLRKGLRDRRTLGIGIVSALVGFVFLMAATVLLLPAIADPGHDLSVAELSTFLVALLVELLIGDDIRRLAGIGGSSSA